MSKTYDRTCAHCGESFEARGHIAAYCSLRCRNRARNARHPRLPKVTPPAYKVPADVVRLAWAAGLIEGEGCILALPGRKSAYDGGQLYVFTLKVVMSDGDVLERLRDAFAIGEVTPYRNTQGLGRKQLHRWEIRRRDAVEAICRAIYPFMGQRRRAQIDYVLDILANNPPVVAAERARRTWIGRDKKAAE